MNLIEAARFDLFVEWTERLCQLNLEKVKEAQYAGSKQIGTVYRRTRAEDGIKLQRTEVRFECLRTPIGGSSIGNMYYRLKIGPPQRIIE